MWCHPSACKPRHSNSARNEVINTKFIAYLWYLPTRCIQGPSDMITFTSLSSSGRTRAACYVMLFYYSHTSPIPTSAKWWVDDKCILISRWTIPFGHNGVVANTIKHAVAFFVNTHKLIYGGILTPGKNTSNGFKLLTFIHLLICVSSVNFGIQLFYSTLLPRNMKILGLIPGLARDLFACVPGVGLGFLWLSPSVCSLRYYVSLY